MNESVLLAIALIVGGLLVIMLVVRFAVWLQWYKREMRYLDKEIARTEGEEKAQWIKRKKKLKRSIISFLR